MSDVIRIAVDAMGGDNAPQEIVKGAVQAIQERDDIHIIFTGDQQAIGQELAKYEYPKEQAEIVHCSEVIETAESPASAVRRKKDSSMMVGIRKVKDGEADAVVSAGNSGAFLVGAQAVIGRIRGVDRPALAPLLPTAKGVSLLIDCGANVDARAHHLLQFAQMGSIYMEKIVGVENPSVGIVNIGAEEEKGNALVKEAFPLLKACPNIRFTGSVEARDIPAGACDVVVCEAFTGNVILKLYEGLGSMLIGKIKDSLRTNLRSKIGGLLVTPALKETMKSFDASEYGGAALLGLEGLAVKTHGSADAREVQQTIYQCGQFKAQNIIGIIRDNLREDPIENT